jgi:hypothetical protein
VPVPLHFDDAASPTVRREQIVQLLDVLRDKVERVAVTK